ncbi:MAG: OmpA family protein, partial [Holophagae bacterium]|nr:OmpA family protein [Holophagae bacterium]
CHIPETGATGRVVYLDLEQDIPREISARAHMISVTLGMDVVSRGDFLLFYKILNRKLPPIIIGTGIVLNPQNTNSTVKILGSSQPLEVGFYAILLPRAEAAPTPVSSEEIPILEKLKEKGEAEGESVSEFTTDVYFDLNGTEISDLAKSELQRAADFLEGKSEYMVILKGYTCSIGNEKYNLALSQKRVENIQKYMAETFSVGDDFFESHFYGEKESVFDNSVEVERRKNRRVSLKILAR